MQTELEKNISKELDYGETLVQLNLDMYFINNHFYCYEDHIHLDHKLSALNITYLIYIRI